LEKNSKFKKEKIKNQSISNPVDRNTKRIIILLKKEDTGRPSLIT